jgi:hypothetical protein
MSKYRTRVFNLIKVDHHGNKVSDDVMNFPWGRLQWQAENNHTPNAKNKDDRYTSWIRVDLNSPEVYVGGQWEWSNLSKEQQEEHRENGNWSEWFSWDNRAGLKQLIGEDEIDY